jgi:hypothetical protein
MDSAMKWNRQWNLATIAMVAMLISGCSCDEARIQFSVDKHIDDVSSPRVRILIPGRLGVREVTLDSGNQSAGPFATGKSGDLMMFFALLSDDSLSTTSGSLELPLKKDWAWGVSFAVSSEDPALTCFGCRGSKSYELDPVLGYDENMRLYVVWGGNSICDPVIY